MRDPPCEAREIRVDECRGIARHERIVTGGGKASMALPQFKWVNTMLGNLKTAITGTYHAFDFAKYAHR